MREQLNCPNCGQPITSEKCEYCGTVFLDFANVKFDHGRFEETYLRLNIDGKLYVVKAQPIDVALNNLPAPLGAFGPFSFAYRTGSRETTLSLNFYLIPDENGELLKIYGGNKK